MAPDELGLAELADVDLGPDADVGVVWDEEAELAAEVERLQSAPLAFPLVAKLESPDLPHKTEAGAVRVGLNDLAELKRAVAQMRESAARYRPGARIDGVLLQEMVGGVETIAGGLVDPYFGPVVVFGLGGVFAEALRVLPPSTAGAQAPPPEGEPDPGAALGAGDADQAQRLDRAIARFAARGVLMELDCLSDLAADRKDRVKRGHRLLENHRNLRTANRPHLGLAKREQVTALEQDRSPDDTAVLGQKPHYREHAHRLTRPRLTDQAHQLSRRNREAHAVDRAYLTVSRQKRGSEVFHIK